MAAQLITLLCLAFAALAQTTMPLDEAARRVPPDYVPAHAGTRGVLEGTVSAPPVHFRQFAHVVIEDGAGHGFTIEAPHAFVSPLRGGDKIRAAGEIGHRAGLPVLRAQHIERLGTGSPPAPVRTRIQDVLNTGALGRYVTVEGFVTGSGQNRGGDVLSLRDGRATITVFLPAAQRQGSGLLGFAAGDRLRVTGMTSQYCAVPPYDRCFQIILSGPGAAMLVNRAWLVSPELLAYSILALVACVGLWWIRERGMATQRRMMRGMTTLAEELLTTSSSADLATRLAEALPPLTGAANVAVYLVNRGSATLDRVRIAGPDVAHSVRTDTAPGTLSAAIAQCFRDGKMMVIPNTARNAVVEKPIDPGTARAALLAPMFASADRMGVLAMFYSGRMPRFKTDRRAAVQHLANQAAAALRLQEQRSMREQLLRSEKMAAAGQLISEVADELRAPLSTIAGITDELRAAALSSVEPAIEQVAAAARRGSDIVDHLLAFARMEQTEPKPIEIFGVAGSLVALRQAEASRKGVQLDNAVPISSVQVMADRSQIEQVLLSLVVHAEVAAAGAVAGTVCVAGRVVGKRAQISISYTATDEVTSRPEHVEAFDLRVCEALIQSHGGELRTTRSEAAGRFDIELPVYQQVATGDAGPQRVAARRVTVLVVEPDVATQRKLVTFLGLRGHRVVPVEDFDSAAYMVQRFPFDVALCVERTGESTWVDFFQRVRRSVGSFVLMAEPTAAATGPAFETGEALLLPKPANDLELDELFKDIELRQPASHEAR
jgi:signal transduction histidine kinase